MARQRRIEYAGAHYHVTSRGDRQEIIYEDDGDRRAWLRILGVVCNRFHWRVHAYCQMGNHYHLVVETVEANLSRGMRQLNGEYTQCFNYRHAVRGHVFQGRYHALLVQRDAYLMALARYVVLNPVRADVVDAPDQWQWSSYLMMLGDADPPTWLETDWTLSQFAHQREFAVHAYREFVMAGCRTSIPLSNVVHRIPATDDGYAIRGGVPAGAPGSGEIVCAPVTAGAMELGEYGLRYSSRTEAMARAYLSGAYTMAEISKHFAVHAKTVSRAVQSVERR